MAIKWLIDTAEFQSTRSARSATDIDVSFDGASDISIHALREERDHAARPPARPPPHFNPRAPRGARPSRRFRKAASSPHFNPRAPRGARHHPTSNYALSTSISIHALREERDTRSPSLVKSISISIHALREERDDRPCPPLPHQLRFQSTRSARSATMSFYSLSVYPSISIHALREERDLHYHKNALSISQFQSTRSARSATCRGPG